MFIAVDLVAPDNTSITTPPVEVGVRIMPAFAVWLMRVMDGDGVAETRRPPNVGTEDLLRF
jgi:hypothetical protein